MLKNKLNLLFHIQNTTEKNPIVALLEVASNMQIKHWASEALQAELKAEKAIRD